MVGAKHVLGVGIPAAALAGTGYLLWPNGDDSRIGDSTVGESTVYTRNGTEFRIPKGVLTYGDVKREVFEPQERKVDGKKVRYVYRQVRDGIDYNDFIGAHVEVTGMNSKGELVEFDFIVDDKEALRKFARNTELGKPFGVKDYAGGRVTGYMVFQGQRLDFFRVHTRTHEYDPDDPNDDVTVPVYSMPISSVVWYKTGLGGTGTGIPIADPKPDPVAEAAKGIVRDVMTEDGVLKEDDLFDGSGKIRLGLIPDEVVTDRDLERALGRYVKKADMGSAVSAVRQEMQDGYVTKAGLTQAIADFVPKAKMNGALKALKKEMAKLYVTRKDVETALRPYVDEGELDAALDVFRGNLVDADGNIKPELLTQRLAPYMTREGIVQILTDYMTRAELDGRGYVTEDDLDGRDYATSGDVDQKLAAALAGCVKEDTFKKFKAHVEENLTGDSAKRRIMQLVDDLDIDGSKKFAEIDGKLTELFDAAQGYATADLVEQRFQELKTMIEQDPRLTGLNKTILELIRQELPRYRTEFQQAMWDFVGGQEFEDAMHCVAEEAFENIITSPDFQSGVPASVGAAVLREMEK